MHLSSLNKDDQDDDNEVVFVGDPQKSQFNRNWLANKKDIVF